MTGQKDAEFGEVKVKGGVRAAIFFALPLDEKLPDSVKPGDQLLGPVGYGEPAFPPAGKKSRGAWNVQYSVTAGAADGKKADDEDDDRTPQEKLRDAIRDAEIKHLEALRKWNTRDEHNVLLERLLKSHNKHLPLHLERFKGLEEIHNPEHLHRRE